jgi:hypothetical protein
MSRRPSSSSCATAPTPAARRAAATSPASPPATRDSLTESASSPLPRTCWSSAVQMPAASPSIMQRLSSSTQTSQAASVHATVRRSGPWQASRSTGKGSIRALLAATVRPSFGMVAMIRIPPCRTRAFTITRRRRPSWRQKRGASS